MVRQTKIDNSITNHLNEFIYFISFTDGEFFHHLENFSNTLESSVIKSILSSSKESLITKSIIGHKRSVAPRDTLRPDSRHVSMGHLGPSLTSCNTLRPKGHHVSRGHQVPSPTPCPNSRYILIGVFLSKKVLVDTLPVNWSTLSSNRQDKCLH